MWASYIHAVCTRLGICKQRLTGILDSLPLLAKPSSKQSNKKRKRERQDKNSGKRAGSDEKKRLLNYSKHPLQLDYQAAGHATSIRPGEKLELNPTKSRWDSHQNTSKRSAARENRVIQ